MLKTNNLKFRRKTKIKTMTMNNIEPILHSGSIEEEGVLLLWKTYRRRRMIFGANKKSSPPNAYKYSGVSFWNVDTAHVPNMSSGGSFFSSQNQYVLFESILFLNKGFLSRHYPIRKIDCYPEAVSSISQDTNPLHYIYLA